VAFSPDGRRLAYASCTAECDVYVLALDTDLTAVGPPRRITSQRSRGIANVAWARDGRSIIYDSDVGLNDLSRLMRVDVDGRRAPERIELAGVNVFGPSTAHMTDRIAFSRRLSDLDIYAVHTNVGGALRVLSSSFSDFDPQYSPAGDTIVFASARSGRASELWLADSGGSRIRRLVDGPGRWQASPQWSPDGQRIAFQSLGDDGRFHIWTVDTAGKTPARLTARTSDEWYPSWSRDGRMIYFSAEEGRRWDIWRVSATGGTPERITHTGNAGKGFESADGTRLVYQERFPQWPTRVLVQPLSGGDPVEVLDCVMDGSLSAGPSEFYYADCGQDPSARALDIDTGQNRVLARLEAFAGSSIAVRATGDGAEVLYTRHNGAGVDLFLIDNFK
jgi:Tol biopolymer transport system component